MSSKRRPAPAALRRGESQDARCRRVLAMLGKAPVVRASHLFDEQAQREAEARCRATRYGVGDVVV